MMAPPSENRILGSALIFGCGYLGRRVANRWLSHGREVFALTRGRALELQNMGVTPIIGDVLNPESLKALPRASTVLYAVGMDRTAGRSMRDVYVNGLENVLKVLPQECRLIYVSSTSVYGQTDGSEVVEDSPILPLDESGRVVRDAELLLRELRPDAIILRFAGIYGPGRLLRKQALLKGEPLVGDADKWLNLIHVEDGVTAILTAESKAPRGETYLVADGTPVRRRDFYTFLAQQLQAPEARFTEPEHLQAQPPEANRKICTLKIRSELGFIPRYPSYAQGLPVSLD